MSKPILRIALRYSLRKGKIPSVMLLSIIVVGASVFGIISVLGLLNGLQDQAIKNILQVSSYHLQVSFSPEHVPSQFTDEILDYPEVTTVVPYYEEETLVLTENGDYIPVMVRALPSNIRSIDPIFAREIGFFQDTLLPGGALVGVHLASTAGVNWGYPIQLLALGGGGSVLRPAMYQPRIDGIIYSKDSGMNSRYIIIPLEDRSAVLPENSNPRFGIKTTNHKEADSIKNTIIENYPDATVFTWKELHQDFVAALELEKMVLTILLGLLVLFAGISVKHSVNRLLRGKRKELAMLKATGANREQLQGITLGMGGILGVLGVLFGVLSGYLFLLYSNEIISGILKIIQSVVLFFGGYFSPPILYTMSYRISPFEITTIILTTMFIVLYSTWRGSIDIVKNSPLEVIKYE